MASSFAKALQSLQVHLLSFLVLTGSFESQLQSIQFFQAWRFNLPKEISVILQGKQSSKTKKSCCYSQNAAFQSNFSAVASCSRHEGDANRVPFLHSAGSTQRIDKSPLLWEQLAKIASIIYSAAASREILEAAQRDGQGTI